MIATGGIRRVTDWLWRLREAREPCAGTVVLLPFAGGSAYSLPEWPLHLPPGPQVLSVQYPGRGPRFNDGPPESVEAMAAEVAADLEAVDGGPLTLLGHSMGAVVGYEVAWIFEQQGRPATQLVVTAARPPHTRLEREPLHEYPHDRLVAALRERGGLPQEALDSDELMEMLLPVIRADLRLVSGYRFGRGERRLATPIVAAGGDADPAVPTDVLRRWLEVAASECDVHVFSGGHFFYPPHMPALAAIVARRLPEATF